MPTPCCTTALIEHALGPVAPATTAVVLVAVVSNFVRARRDRLVAGQRPSIVGTASMLAFFATMYLLIKLHIGVGSVSDDHLRILAKLAGAALMVAGCICNLMGRAALGQNWANQATLYDDQSLVTAGVYSIARHPLYSSLTGMFYGSALLYQNIAVALATTLIFLPAMYYRASLEEKLLAQRFSDYSAYQVRVGMIFPKLFHSTRGVR